MPEFEVYFLKFESPLHIGKQGVGIEKISEIISSDTLWGGIINSWIKLFGDDILNEFLNKNPPFLISSGFPFFKDNLFYPKPFYFKLFVEEKNNDILRNYTKLWKKSKFIPYEIFNKILKGESLNLDDLKLNAERQKLLKDNISILLRPRVKIGAYSEEESDLYFIGEMFFSQDAGFFFMVKFNKDVKSDFEKALQFLGEEGIGGKRSYGYGKFKIFKREKIKFPEEDYKFYITLSPVNDPELLKYLEESFYSIDLRKGWSLSPLTKNQTRWKPVIVFNEGSIFPFEPKGRIVDVSPDEKWKKENHPIYRYLMGFYLKFNIKNET